MNICNAISMNWNYYLLPEAVLNCLNRERYDYTALLRQNDEYRSRWSITLLITVAACFFIDFTAMGQLEIFFAARNWRF